MTKVVNLIIAILFCLFLILRYFSFIHPEAKLYLLLKYIVEASLIGAIADTYAVFGLFYKIGPHTDILRRKKDDIIEKVKKFVSEFLFSKKFLDEELDKLDVEIFSNLENKEFSQILKENIKKHLTKKFGNRFIDEICDIVVKALITILAKSKKVENLTKKLIKEIIIQNHNLIEELIEKRLNEIEDEEFINILKKSSWDELQWIRINGIVLGSIIGLIIGLVNLYI